VSYPFQFAGTGWLLGVDPFNLLEVFPVAFGELVSFYENVAK
jgi:hypothetical protein